MDDQEVHIAIATPLSPEALGMIRAMSNRINLEEVSALILGERKGDGAASAQLDSLLAPAEVL